MPPQPNRHSRLRLRRQRLPRLSGPADSTSTGSRSEAALEVRWRSGGMAGDDCIGTVELTRGSAALARFVAFVMDSAGAVMARDWARADLAVAGLLVDFRFRHVDCDEIADWQFEATTPNVQRAGPGASQSPVRRCVRASIWCRERPRRRCGRSRRAGS